VEIRAEAVLFSENEYINGIAVAVPHVTNMHKIWWACGTTIDPTILAEAINNK
jgi:hypothetical protein